MPTMSRQEYVGLFGPTTGDRIRLGDTGLFVAEGTSLLLTAREAGWVPKLMAFLTASEQPPAATQFASWAERAGAECLEVSAAVLAKLAGKDNPQIMLGVYSQRWAGPPEASAVQRVRLATENDCQIGPSCSRAWFSSDMQAE